MPYKARQNHDKLSALQVKLALVLSPLTLSRAILDNYAARLISKLQLSAKASFLFQQDYLL